MTAVLPVSALLLSSPALPAHRGLEITLVAAQTAQRKARVPPPVKEPAVQTMTDARADAAGRAQLFERIPVPGFTDLRQGFNGTAVADLDRDGLLDLVVTSAEPTIQAGARGGTRLRIFRNLGDFRFRENAIQITGQGGLSAANFRARAQVPVLADFNLDGFLELFVTRSTPMNAGRLLSTPLGNTFLLSQGRWDVFKDVSRAMGTGNEHAYNRQASLGDVNGDGWLDIAIGADNIGNAQGGLPHSRLYVFRPKGDRFEDGSFEDIGGTKLAPGFGGFYRDKSRDRAGPDINLRDLDNDGDLDLVQSYHVDCRAPELPYSPCEYQQGVFLWRNMLRETGAFRFSQVTDNGLAEVGQLRYNPTRRAYETALVGAGLPYLSFGDPNNDGKLDVIAVGPSDPGWSPRAEPVGGRFWFNLGELRFRRATDEAGLGSLNWPYRERYRFQGHPLPASRRFIPQREVMTAQPGLKPGDPLDDRPATTPCRCSVISTMMAGWIW